MARERTTLFVVVLFCYNYVLYDLGTLAAAEQVPAWSDAAQKGRDATRGARARAPAGAGWPTPRGTDQDKARKVTIDDLVAAISSSTEDVDSPAYHHHHQRALAVWSRVAAAAGKDARVASKYPQATAMHGILLARSATADDTTVAAAERLLSAAAPLDRQSNKNTDTGAAAGSDIDWVAYSYLAGLREVLARRLLQHQDSTEQQVPHPALSTYPPSPANGIAVELPDVHAAVRSIVDSAFESPARKALAEAALLYDHAIRGRLAWLQRHRCATNISSQAAADRPFADVAAAACLAQLQPAAASSYPQARYAKPPTLLYRGLGTGLHWLGREQLARQVHRHGSDAGTRVGWVDASGMQRPIVPFPMTIQPRAFFDKEESCSATDTDHEDGSVPTTGVQSTAASCHLSDLLTRLEAAIPMMRAEFVAAYRSQAGHGTDRAGLDRDDAPRQPSEGTRLTPAADLDSEASARITAAADGDSVVQPLARGHDHHQTRNESIGFAPETAGLHSGSTWTVLPLFIDGAVQQRACNLAPQTCAFLGASVPLARVASGQVKYSVMRAGTHVRPHAGPSNARLRIHCTLQLFRGGEGAATFRVGGEHRHWKDSECFAFDESMEHEVWARAPDNTSPPTAADAVADYEVSVKGPSGSQYLDRTSDDVRAVIIIDIANLFLARRQDFTRHAMRCSEEEEQGCSERKPQERNLSANFDNAVATDKGANECSELWDHIQKRAH